MYFIYIKTYHPTTGFWGRRTFVYKRSFGVLPDYKKPAYIWNVCPRNKIKLKHLLLHVERHVHIHRTGLLRKYKSDRSSKSKVWIFNGSGLTGFTSSCLAFKNNHSCVSFNLYYQKKVFCSKFVFLFFCSSSS